MKTITTITMPACCTLEAIAQGWWESSRHVATANWLLASPTVVWELSKLTPSQKEGVENICYVLDQLEQQAIAGSNRAEAASACKGLLATCPWLENRSKLFQYYNTGNPYSLA